jgi:hypothetical protein
LAEARATRYQNTLEDMHLKLANGEITRGDLQPSVALHNPCQIYDTSLLSSIQKRWLDLLAQHQMPFSFGKVQVDFCLRQDGTIADVRTTRNDLAPIMGLLCQKAAFDMAPFGPWPPMMHQEYGSTQRNVTITFCHGEPSVTQATFKVDQQQPHLLVRMWESSSALLNSATASKTIPARANSFDPYCSPLMDPPNPRQSPFPPFTYDSYYPFWGMMYMNSLMRHPNPYFR